MGGGGDESVEQGVVVWVAECGEHRRTAVSPCAARRSSSAPAASASRAGRVAAWVRSRSVSTSVSRTAPTRSASQRNSERSDLVHSWLRDGGEGLQVGPQPPGGDAELVDVLGVLAQPHTGIVADHAGD